MNRFAELLDRLAYEPGRNNKLRLLTAYFREAEDPDRGYALGALTGALSFKHAKPALIRDLIAARTALRPHQRDGLGEVTDVIIRQREQHRVGAGGDEIADQRRLGVLERQCAG
ncbi:MAG: hypothetical protein ACK495_27325, partial [Bradyrhizobium sp.]